LAVCTDANDEVFWRELPAALRTDMALELAGPIFRHSDIFKALDRSAERLVAARLTPLVVPAGHNVVQEGDDADCLFLLQQGESSLCVCPSTHSQCLYVLGGQALLVSRCLLSA